MFITQFLLPDATAYERKCQRLDFVTLGARHHVQLLEPAAAGSVATGVAHIYAPPRFDPQLLKALRVPRVATGAPRMPRFGWRRAPPAPVLTPLNDEQGSALHVPEAVEEIYFNGGREPAPAVIGSFARPGVLSHVEQVMARIDRFRDDVVWNLFDRQPSPAELASLAGWVDPAVEEADFDGFVAEALVSGVPVVAAATPLNVQRLESGRCGFLVPPRDPNEMTHAILAALFKPELSRPKSEAARQTAAKYRPRHRVRVLEQIYESVMA